MKEFPVSLLYGFIFVFGLIIGSFLNVLIARLPRHESLIHPGSKCPQCRKKIKIRDNIPLLSFIFLKGRCRFCRKKIPLQYPLVELMTGLVFLASGMKFGLSPVLVLRDWPFLSILIAVSFIDLEHRIIPDKLSLGGLVFGLITSWANPDLGMVRSFLGAAVGFLFFYSVGWFYFRWRGRLGLGGGDIKLLAFLGSFLGPSGVFVTILISSVLGSLGGLGWGLLKVKKELMKISLPYGPFLVLGGLFYYFLGDWIWLQFMTPI